MIYFFRKWWVTTNNGNKIRNYKRYIKKIQPIITQKKIDKRIKEIQIFYCIKKNRLNIENK